MTKCRFQYIDLGKAIAMLFVVFGHINLFGIYGDEHISTCQVSKYTSILQLTLFMFLSGLVASSSPLGYKEVIKQLLSMARHLLMPFFVVGSLFAYVVCHQDLWGFLSNSPKLGYWYLWVLFLYYITLYFFRLITSSFKTNVWIDIATGGIFLAMIILEQTLSSKIVDYLSMSLAKSLYPAFFAGVMVKRYNLHNLLFESKKVYTIALIAVLAYIMTDVCGIHYSGGMVLFQYGFIIVLLHWLSKFEGKDGPLLAYLNLVGSHTLDVYVYHYFILQLCRVFWLRPILIHTYSPLIEVAVTGTLTIIVTTLSIYIGKVIRECKPDKI